MPYAEYAEQFAGNWKEFQSFGWYGKPDTADQCGIYNGRSRDSDLLTISNWEVLQRELDPFIGSIDDGATIEIQTHSHWGPGWLECFVIQVYKDGEITEGFKQFCDLVWTLEDYPVLDESDYCEREYNDTLENIENIASRYVSPDAPDTWVTDLYGALPDSEVEPRDGFGGYPSDEAVIEALKELDENRPLYLDPDSVDEEEEEVEFYDEEIVRELVSGLSLNEIEIFEEAISKRKKYFI